MKVCVLGLWHLGTVTAACLASAGHDVLGLDFDEAVVRELQAGTPPVGEPGLAALIAEGMKSGRLRFAATASELAATEVLWVAYDTPVDDDDVADVEYVVSRVRDVLADLPAGTTVLVSSQLPVGTIRRLESLAIENWPEKALGFACSPENLRLGKALDVFMKPDRVVVGTRSERDRLRIDKLLAPITSRIEWMSVESAEMTKHAINSFLATSVVFANEIASICEAVGADAKEVERGLKSEQRIGPKAYLSPGAAFAGGTLARDIDFLRTASRGHDVTIPLLGSVKASNDHHKAWARGKIEALFEDVSRVPVAVWGLTYKPGTDTLRRSLSVELCNWLLERGATVRVHDPAARELPADWSGLVQRFDSPLDAVANARVLVVGTEWPAYREIQGHVLAERAPGLTILDANRFLLPLATQETLRYLAVGTPLSEASA